MAGSYYFLYEKQTTTVKTAYNYVMLASFISALAGLVMKSLLNLVKTFNLNEIKYKLIKNHYLLMSKKNKKLTNELMGRDNMKYLNGYQVLKFSFFEKFTYLRNKFSLCHKTTKNEKIYDIGSSKLNEELDLMNIIQQLKKLSAVVDSLVEHAQAPLFSCYSKNYVESVAIFTDSEE